MLRNLRHKRLGLIGLLGALVLLAAGGCGGKLANPGYAMVSQACPNGAILLHYPDGKAKWKRLDSDNPCKDISEVAKNLYQPAKVVETKKGSTITFPCGDTFIYRDLPKGCSNVIPSR
jgi:hypothetical protein